MRRFFLKHRPQYTHMKKLPSICRRVVTPQQPLLLVEIIVHGDWSGNITLEWLYKHIKLKKYFRILVENSFA